MQRWALAQSITLDQSMIEQHIVGAFPLAAGRIERLKLLAFRTGVKAYLPFALSTSSPFG
ncbi:MAG: hypothetical protein WC990_08280 [Sphaerochaetaceae bacterium]